MRFQDPLSLRSELDVALESVRRSAGYLAAVRAAMAFALDLARTLLLQRSPVTLVGAALADGAARSAERCVEAGFARAAVAEAERAAVKLLTVPGAPTWLYPAVNVNDPVGAARAALALAEAEGLISEVEAGLRAISAAGG